MEEQTPHSTLVELLMDMLTPSSLPFTFMILMALQFCIRCTWLETLGVYLIILAPGILTLLCGQLLSKLKYPKVLIQQLQTNRVFSSCLILPSELASKISKSVTTEMEMAIAMTGMTKKEMVVQEVFTLLTSQLTTVTCTSQPKPITTIQFQEESAGVLQTQTQSSDFKSTKILWITRLLA